MARSARRKAAREAPSARGMGPGGIAKMMVRQVMAGLIALCATVATALAGDCPGRADALGTSRVLYVDPADHPLIGSIQYRETLPLADHEVVITFDDGPSVTNTARVLDMLRAECVKATFFAVGAMAHNSPALLRRAYDEGHTIGSHSQSHPLNLSHMPPEAAWQEMADGITTLTRALGKGRQLAPFLRFPALNRTSDLELKAMAAGQMVWSADVYADDWMHITPDEVARRPLERLAQAGRGVLLLHDIQTRTVAALPQILRGLKQGGFKVVHVAPAGGGEAKTATAAGAWHALNRSLLGLPAHMQPARDEK
jgi:peptidoglycan-N-acetylglucosamine deacetylase